MIWRDMTVAQDDFHSSQRIGLAAGALPALPAIAPPLRLPPPQLPGSPGLNPASTPAHLCGALSTDWVCLRRHLLPRLGCAHRPYHPKKHRSTEFFEAAPRQTHPAEYEQSYDFGIRPNPTYNPVSLSVPRRRTAVRHPEGVRRRNAVRHVCHLPARCFHKCRTDGTRAEPLLPGSSPPDTAPSRSVWEMGLAGDPVKSLRGSPVRRRSSAAAAAKGHERPQPPQL
jgi:hypothetical protein